LLTAIG